MKELIRNNIQGRKVLTLFIITNIVYVVMLTITIPKVMGFAGGMKLLDMLPTGYTHEYVNLLLSTLGDKGRHSYLVNQIPIDMLYPFLFGVSNCLMLAYFWNKLGKLNSNLFYLCYLPLFSGLFDYAENIGIVTMLNKFPANSILLSQTTSVFSVLKSFLTSAYFIILLIALISFGKYRLSIKK